MSTPITRVPGSLFGMMMLVSSNRHRMWQRAGVIGCTVFFTALVVWLVLKIAQGDLQRGDQLARIVSMFVALVSLPMTLFSLVIAARQRRQAKAIRNLSEQLDVTADVLAIAVRAQWEAEEQVRRIHDPFPLPSRWSNADEQLTDHWQNIYGSPDQQHPIALHGHLDQIVDAFNKIPSRRLVVLGRAGAGKTILASRFVLTLLAGGTRSSEEPVPVIFSLGSWDPTISSLRNWLTDQLLTNYPILADKDDTGATLAAQLLATRRILPVLDGFDEITDRFRVDAITEINAGLRPGDPLLLTSRHEEYAAAVEAGDVLTAAAVVQIEDLTLDDLTRYLPLTTRKKDINTAQTKWHPVLNRMRESSDHAALVTVLSTPLMVTLARAIFSDTSADPAKLFHENTTISRDDQRRRLEDLLLAGFVPAVYSRTFHDNRPPESQHFDADDASRWLGFLANHLRGFSTYDLAWWQLVRAVPRLVVGLVAGLVISVLAWLVAGLGGWLGDWGDRGGQMAWLTATFVAGLVCGAVGGTIIGLGRGIRPSPARIRLKIRGRLGRVTRDLTRGLRRWRTIAWIFVWAVGGTIFGLASSFVGKSEGVILVGLGAGLFAGSGIWFVVTFVRALGAPVDPTETVSPAALLRTDRTSALRQGLAVGVGSAGVFWLMMWFAFEPAFGLPFKRVYGSGLWFLGWLISVAAGSLIWMLFVTAWGPWLITRMWLPLTRRLPWSVMNFLADAHQRGVLRQAGGVYQFRHARLQDHLATAYQHRLELRSSPSHRRR